MDKCPELSRKGCNDEKTKRYLGQKPESMSHCLLEVDNAIRKAFPTPKLKYTTWTKCMQPCSETGEISGLNSSLTVSLLFTACTFYRISLPLFLLLDVNKNEKCFPVYTEDSQNRKVRTVLRPCNSAEHRSDPVESHECAAILQGATSGAAVLKVGVGQGPAVTV